MESRKKRKHPRLPRTSRVNERIIEYYTKFGQGRDLEKFMRLHSPSGSHRSHNHSHSRTTTTTASSTSRSCGSSISDEHICINRMLILSEATTDICPLTASKSLPNVGTFAGEDANDNQAGEDIIVAIVEETEGRLDRDNPCSASAEEIRTPNKSIPTKTKQTQTPDSIVKSHKRLEWDSLGDVGYIKSMSTSNISILERSLLKDFFQDNSAVSVSKKGPLKTTEVKSQPQKTYQGGKNINAKEKSTATKHNTRPLASSTLLESNAIKKKSTQSQRPAAMHSKSEKCVQTSMHKAELVSQEIQVNMSSTTPSAAGSLTTPTSFSYFSSRSSQSTTTSNDMPSKQKNREKDKSNPYIKSIARMLAQRRMTAPNRPTELSNHVQIEDEDPQLQQMHETLAEVLDEDKENSTFLHSPQLDLGIQLICSLIEAKSLTEKQRKKLVRDIVKRISRIESFSNLKLSAANSQTSSNSCRKKTLSEATKANTDTITYKSHDRLPGGMDRKESHERRYAPLEESSNCEEEKLQTLRTYKMPSYDRLNELNDPNKEKLIRVFEYNNQSPPTTSREAAAKSTTSTKNTKASEKPPTEKVPTRSTSKNDSSKHMQMKNLHTGATTERSATTTRSDQRNRNASSSASVLSSSSTSRDIITQKSARPIITSAMDTDAPTMREWYNPMTQSEIEYEERRRQPKTDSVKSKRSSKRQKGDISAERDIQLNWIEAELQRLEGLRKLLLQEDDTTSTGKDSQSQEIETTTSQSSERRSGSQAYDTVYSETSSKSDMQEVQVSVEESHEDILDASKNKRQIRERTRVTTVAYTKASEANPLINPRFRTTQEVVRTQTDEVIPEATQRSRIDTPSGSGSGSGDTPSTGGSVRSFAEQRKREFLEHYKNKKQQHYAAILKQREQTEQEQPVFNIPITAASTTRIPRMNTENHYSIPHTIHRSACPLHCCNPCCHHTYSFPIPPPPPCLANPSTSTSDTGNRNTSSSVFCLSSEVSIPMGSNPTSSSTTTTHQYDDVAGGCTSRKGVKSTGIGCQTGASLQRSRPLFGTGRTCFCRHQRWHISTRTQDTNRTAGVQVLPKPLAYVITFDNKKLNKTTEPKSNGSGSGSRNGKVEIEVEHKPEHDDGSVQEEAWDREEKEDEEEIEIGREESIEAQPTLQEYLQRAHPRFITQAQRRKAILNEMQSRRHAREREMRDIIENTSLTSIERKLTHLPPPPTQQIRIFPTREMKAMTKRKVSKLSEVVKKKERDIEERTRRGNRILKTVFNQRLQKRVRQGQLSLNHSKTLI